MSKGTKIYLVTRGFYDDYCVIAATLDKKKAEALRDKFYDGNIHSGDEYHVEEYVDHEIDNRPIWQVNFSESGDVKWVENNGTNSSYYYRYAINERCYQLDSEKEFCTYVFAEDEQSAIKKAAERIAEYRKLAK